MCYEQNRRKKFAGILTNELYNGGLRICGFTPFVPWTGGGKLVKEVFDYENKLSSEMFDNEFNNASCGTVDVVETLCFSWRKQCNIS